MKNIITNSFKKLTCIYASILIILCLFAFTVNQVKAQTTCATSIAYTIGDTTGTVYLMTDTAYWYKFTSSGDSVTAIGIYSVDSIYVDTIRLYHGTCSGLILDFDTVITSHYLSTSFRVYHLNPTYTYYLQLSQPLSDTSKFSVASIEFDTPGNTCSTNTPCNLLTNGTFSNFIGSGADAFGLNLIDCWGAAFGSPDHDGAGPYEAGMWGASWTAAGSGLGEGIVQTLSPNTIQVGDQYLIHYTYKNIDGPGIPIDNIFVFADQELAGAFPYAIPSIPPFPRQMLDNNPVVINNVYDERCNIFTGDANGPYTSVILFPFVTSAVSAYLNIENVFLWRITAGVDDTIPCIGSVQLGCDPPDPILAALINISWSPVVGLSDPTIANPIASPPVTTIYTMTVTDCSGHTATSTVTVTVASSMIITLDVTNIPSCYDTTAGSIFANVTGGTPAYSFLWSNGETTNPAIDLSAGIYTVTVTDSAGCTASATISLGEQCCLGDTNVLEFNIIYGGNISTNTVWDESHLTGKYLVVGTLIVNSGVMLDITNVDVLFAPCATIIFQPGANLQANNSVFRPCEVNGVWKGLQFFGSTANVINICEFKDAATALDFETDALGNPSDGEITGNLFNNCNEGIKVVSNPQFNYPISGNKFEIDPLYPKFSTSPCASSPINYSIYSMNSGFTIPISQNNFIKGLVMASLPAFGIELERTSGQVSFNQFTDMDASILIDDPSKGSSIENNKIEIINNINPNPAGGQIDVSQAFVPILVYNNNIVNSNHVIPMNTSYSGIYATKCADLDIKSNQINGFNTGIFLNTIKNSQVVENTITDANYYGIYIDNSSIGVANPQRLNIGCNDIDLHDVKQLSGTSVGIIAFEMDKTCNVYSNCVFDTYNGIYLSTGTSCSTIPNVQNNYIYNYENWGIYDNGYTGTIGSSFANPGTNTLNSNSNMAAMDIAAVGISSCAPPFLFANGNWLFFISTGTVISNFNNIYSNASCSNQIFSQPSQFYLDNVPACDSMTFMLAPLKGDVGPGTYSLSSNFEQELVLMKGDIYPIVISIQNALCTNADKTLAIEFNNSLNQNSWITSQEKSWVNYYFNLNLNYFSLASSFLSSIHPGNNNEEDLWNIENINMKLLQGQYPNNVPVNADLEILESIVVAGRDNANYAGVMLNNFGGNNLPVLPNELMPIYDNTIKGERLAQNIIDVYPNPAKDEITVSIEINSKVAVNLEDVTGRLIRTIQFDPESSTQVLNIADLNNGVYLIVASDENNKYIQQTKFVKLK